MQVRPSFDELPLHPSDPPHSAWGLYGKEDELGTLNLLTEDLVLTATKEVQLGITISLNLPLDVPSVPMNPERKVCNHRFNIKPLSNDDELEINTQSSTHWDGLRHVGYQRERLFYNGMTQDEISGAQPSPRLGIHNLSRRAIAGRGVLLDYRSWAKSNGIEYDSFTTRRVALTELLQCAEAQKTEFRSGDILLVRFGWTEDYLQRSDAERRLLGGKNARTFVGVENSLEMARWHWEMGFAAVASDTNAYEAWFPDTKSNLGCSLHEVFLAGWGMPIGELWNLEQLATKCRQIGKWSFFLSSQPLDIPGGVASPSNAMAIL